MFGVKPFTRYDVYKAGGSMGEDQKAPYGKEPEVTMFFISDGGINGWWVAQASCSPFPGPQRQFWIEVGSSNLHLLHGFEQVMSSLRAGVPSFVNSRIVQ